MEIVLLVLAVAALLAAVLVSWTSERRARAVHKDLRERLRMVAARTEVIRAPSPDPWGVVVARRVVVNLKSGRAIDGVLVRRDGPLLFLRNAVLLEEGSEPAAIDGEAVVESVDVDFIQAL